MAFDPMNPNGFGSYLQGLGWGGEPGSRREFVQGLRQDGQHPWMDWWRSQHQNMGGGLGGLAQWGQPPHQMGPGLPNYNTGIVPPHMQEQVGSYGKPMQPAMPGMPGMQASIAAPQMGLGGLADRSYRPRPMVTR